MGERRSRRAREHCPSRAESIAAFKAYVVANGGEVLTPTNEWEAIRFRGHQGVSIIYLNAKKRVTFTGVAARAWEGFCSGTPYRLVPSVTIRLQRDVVMRTLVERDGPNCFYCDELPTDDNMPTREHLVARTHGGPDHIANQFIACSACNRRAGHLSVAEKIRLRDEIRMSRRTAANMLSAVLAEVAHV